VNIFIIIINIYIRLFE